MKYSMEVKIHGHNKEGDMVDIREDSSREPKRGEEVYRELEVDSRELDSSKMNTRELYSRDPDSKELHSRSRGQGMNPDLHCGATSRTGVTGRKAAGSSILTRVFSREAWVKLISRKKYKWGWDNLSPTSTQKKTVKQRKYQKK